MDVEEALRVADAAVFAKTKEHLSDIQKFILQGSRQDLPFGSCFQMH